jgi:hypothetical protein
MLSVGVRWAQTQLAQPDRINRPSLTTSDASNLVSIYTPHPRLGFPNRAARIALPPSGFHHPALTSGLSPSLPWTSTATDAIRTEVAARTPPPLLIGCSHRRHQGYRLCALPWSHQHGATRGGGLGGWGGRRRVCATIIDVAGRQFCAWGGGSTPIASWWREGDFHGGGAVELEVATRRTRLRRKPSWIGIVGSNYYNSRGDIISL